MVSAMLLPPLTERQEQRGCPAGGARGGPGRPPRVYVSSMTLCRPVASRSAAVAALLLVPLLSACASPSANTPGNQPASSSQLAATYVATSSAGATVLQLSVVGTTVSGTIDLAELPTGATQVQTGSDPVSGTYTNGQLTLTIAGNTYSGQVQNGDIVLDVQGSNGSVSPSVYVPAPLAAYNTAVQKLNTEASQASQAAAEQASAQQVQSQIDSDAQALAGAMSQLSQDEANLPADVSQVKSDVAQEQKDLTTTEQEAKTVEGEANPTNNSDGQTCADASNANADASTVAADLSSVGADVSSAQNDLNTVSQDIAALKSAYATYDQFVSEAPQDALPNAATGGQVQAAEAQANSDLQATAGKINAEITAANSLLAQATQAANAASAAGNCGGTDPPGQDLSPISP